MSFQVLNPESMGGAPKGWNNGMLAPAGGRILFVAGQTGRDRSGKVPANGFVDQWAQALDNVLAVVREAGAGPDSIGRMTVYVTDRMAYLNNLKPLGEVWRKRMGKHYPAMALVEVRALVDPNAVVEIEATAVIEG